MMEVPAVKEPEERIRKSAGEWQLYLEGKTPIDANDLSPKEAIAMSRDIKYIGMEHTTLRAIAKRFRLSSC